MKITLPVKTRKINKEYLIFENVSIFDRPSIVSLFYNVILITNCFMTNLFFIITIQYEE